MSYLKCGLCLKYLEVLRSASGIPYIRCVDWKLCPFFYREDSIHSYQQCLCNRVIPEYKVHEGGQLPYCRHMDVATLKVSRSQKNPFRLYFTCRRKEMCRFFQSADQDHLYHKCTCSTNTFQDPSYKDNFPFQNPDIFEHLRSFIIL